MNGCYLSVWVKPLEAGYAKPSVSSNCLRNGSSNNSDWSFSKSMSFEFPVEAKIRCLYRLFGILGVWVPVSMSNSITETMRNIRLVLVKCLSWF